MVELLARYDTDVLIETRQAWRFFIYKYSNMETSFAVVEQNVGDTALFSNIECSRLIAIYSLQKQTRHST